jgi:hypothetical protein
VHREPNDTSFRSVPLASSSSKTLDATSWKNKKRAHTMRAGSHRILQLYSCSSAIAPDVYRDLMGQHWENINTQEI